MAITITDAVKQFKCDWTGALEPKAILDACHEVGHLWRERLLTPVSTMQLFFVQILHGNTACDHLRHLTKIGVSGGAYCQARMKLPLAVFQVLLRYVAQHLQTSGLEEGRWRGHRTFLVDGSSFSMPDTPTLQAQFGQPSGQRPGCGFPVAHLLALFHAKTGMLLDVLAAPLRTHDYSQVVEVHSELRQNDLLLADRGFCSFVHMALLLQRGVHAVIRIHQRQIVDFTPGRPYAVPGQGKNEKKKGLPRSRWIKRLGEKDQVVEWLKPVECPEWMTPEQFAELPSSIQIRELRYQVHRPGFRVKQVTLATTLVDAEAYPLAALSDLYFSRWRVETNFGHLKTTMGMDVLKCKTVDGVLKELIVFALIYNLVRLVIGEAARRQQVCVERISFVDALRWLASAGANELLCRLQVNPDRPYRYEPRVRKRRPKQYSLMRNTRAKLRNSLANNRDTS